MTNERTAKNSMGETLRVGDPVERIDNYKRGGKVMAINHERGYSHVLVRWPNLEDVWMHPGILYVKDATE